jgi:type IV secretory pathway VirB2 component (pilin)
MKTRLRSLCSALTAIGLGIAWSLVARASETGAPLPWNKPLDTLKENLTGPTATVVILIALAFGFMVWAFSDNNHGLFRAFKALIALAVIATAGGFLTSLGITAALV